MFCTSCGKENPDGSTVCGECGKPIGSAVIPNSAQGSGKSATDVNVGAYIKEFFSDPVKAILSRSKPSYLVWGLIIAAIYPVVLFIKYLIDDTPFKYAFAYLFVALCGVAALVFALYLFQNLFKLEKKSLPTIVSTVGLSLTPMFALYVVAMILDKIFDGGALADAFTTVGYIFSGIIICKSYETSKENNLSKTLMLVVISFACALVIVSIFNSVIFKSIMENAVGDYMDDLYDLLG